MEVNRDYLISALRACANEIYENAELIIGNSPSLGAYQVSIALEPTAVPSISIQRTMTPFTYIPDLTDRKPTSN